MKTLVLYECEICGFESVDPEQVRACEARGAPVPLVAVGDIVLAKGGFGWFDGDSAWVSNPAAKKRKVNGRCPVTGDGNCFGLCCCFRFYYVVTLIDRDPDIGGRHRLRYHLWTKAMTGKQGYECGYTFDVGHCKPERVADPSAAVVEASKELLGRLTPYLL